VNAPQPARTAEPVGDVPVAELVRLRDLIYKVAGIFHPDNKLSLLQERCRGRIKTVHVKSLSEYVEFLTTHPSRQAELNALLSDITIGETCFFRNRPQLEAIARVVLPKLIEAKSSQPTRSLRIWSAGCSTGEEPYTLSMLTLDESKGRLKDWVVEIHATDINQRSLAFAQKAVYGSHSTRNLTAFHRQKYFTQVGEEFQVQPMVRNQVLFRHVNLTDDARMALLKRMDLILCCNVLIYFDVASKRRVLRHFYNNLSPHGYLFLGHSESLHGVSDDYRLVHLPGATAYMRGDSLHGKVS